MTTSVYTITPFDTTAFRDGRPFEQDDQGLAETVALFPPPPPAVAGAVMAALAQAIDVAPRPGWDAHAQQLQASADEAERRRGRDLAAILNTSIVGPFVGRWDAGGTLALYARCPADLLFEKPDAEPKAPAGFLRPSPKAICGNFAAARGESWRLEARPAAAVANGEPLSGNFLALRKIDDYLRNRILPGAPVTVSQAETRVGIALDKQMGVAVRSQLYAAQHARLSAKAAFCFAAEGPELASLSGKGIDCVTPFGGEGRFARVQGPFEPADELGASVQDAVELIEDNRIGYRLTALTPVPVSEQKPWGVDLGDLGGEIVAAVHSRPSPLGFLRRGYNRNDVRIIRAFPAGSTWFLKAPAQRGEEKAALEAILAKAQVRQLAPRGLALVGFGRVLAGRF